VFAIIVFLAAGFYTVQNAGHLHGGGIALPKLIWLSYAILFWFCMPLLFILDKRIGVGWKTIYSVFLVNMLLRAVIELVMMYAYRNWSPYYGIAHDVFSMMLLVSLLLAYRNHVKADIFFGFFLTILLMFVVEIAFVLYMLANLIESGSAVYFVPDSDRHGFILKITWLVVFALTAYLFMFTRRWFRGRFVRTGS
jgi:hypothetical protein